MNQKLVVTTKIYQILTADEPYAHYLIHLFTKKNQCNVNLAYFLHILSEK